MDIASATATISTILNTFQTTKDMASQSEGESSNKGIDYEANQEAFLASLEAGGAFTDKVKKLHEELGPNYQQSSLYKELVNEFTHYVQGMKSIPLGDSRYDYLKAQYEPRWRSYAKRFDSINWDEARKEFMKEQGNLKTTFETNTNIPPVISEIVHELQSIQQSLFSLSPAVSEQEKQDNKKNLYGIMAIILLVILIIARG